MKPIDEVCGRATTQLYDELRGRVSTRSVPKIRDAIAAAYSDFIPRILPSFLTSSASELFGHGETSVHANAFTLRIGEARRELIFSTSRRAWSAADINFLTELPRDHTIKLGPIVGATTAAVGIPRRVKQPTKTQGLCVVEVSLDWRVDQDDTHEMYTFVLEDIPDVSAVCVRVPRALRLSFAGVGRIARLAGELTRAFLSWMMETLSDVIRKSAVQLSSQLYHRPRVLLPKAAASTLAFSCLTGGKDFVLFDDASFSGFVDVMEQSPKSTAVSALHLSGILLGEIVAKDYSAIAHVLDKRDGDSIAIDLKHTNAYSNDEALRHAIETAWGSSFTCIKLSNFRDTVFVLFCPTEHAERVQTYVQDSLPQIQKEIKGAYQNIMEYVKLIQELRLSTLFDAPRLPPAKRNWWQLTRPLQGVARDKAVRDQVISAAGSLLRKIFIGT